MVNNLYVSNLSNLIVKTAEEYRDTEIIAFLGIPNSGKTIVTALLGHTLNKSFIPNSKGKWDVVYTSGYDEINEIIQGISNGVFPPATFPDDYPDLTIEIHGMEGRPTVFDLEFLDISEEDYRKFIAADDFDLNKKLKNILSNDSRYIPFAKKYIILINCEEKEKWIGDGARVNSMLSTLRAIRNKISNADLDIQMDVPIAIVFSKCDTLPENLQDKSADELIDEYDGLGSSLKINAGMENVVSFKLSVNSRKESLEESKKRVEEEKQKIKRKIKLEKKKIEKQIQTSIDTAVASARQEAQNQGYDDEYIRRIMNETREKREDEYRNEVEGRIQKFKKPIAEDQIWVVDQPLVYSESEYSKFISWILNEEYDV